MNSRLPRPSRFFALGATCLLLAIRAGAAPPTSHFVVYLTSSPEGFETRCPEGCMGPATLLRLDCDATQVCRGERFDNGVRGLPRGSRDSGEPLPPGSKFSFLMTRTAEGMKLRSKSGCAWRTLSYSCGGSERCSVRIDERGIRKALPEEIAP